MDKPAAFGPPITKEGIIGNLLTMPIDNMYGCQPVAASPCSYWIALVERGNCSFVEKVRSLQKSGAIAVIIGDRHSNSWITMYPAENASDITIPSVYVAQYQYLSLLKHIQDQKPKPISIELTQDESFSWTKSDLSLLLLSCMGLLYAFYLTWRIPQRHIDAGYDQEEMASIETISSLPSKLFHKEKSDTMPIDECIICLDEYQEGDPIRILPCHHEFHIKCIDPWLTTRKRFCPICKYKIYEISNEHTPLLRQ